MKTSIYNLAHRHGHARFSPYLASPMERTLKAYFVLFHFLIVKNKWFQEAAQLSDMYFIIYSNAYIYQYFGKN